MTRHPTNTINDMERQDSAAGSAPREAWSYAPEADIYERDDAYMVVLDMPGVAAENIDLTVDQDRLVVHGRVAREEAASPGRAVHREYGVGDYFRRFDLAGRVDVEAISAECRHGVLTIHLPKVEAARRKRIEVTGAN